MCSPLKQKAARGTITRSNRKVKVATPVKSACGDDVPRYTSDSCHWSLVNIFMENFSFLSCMGSVFDIKNDGAKPPHKQLNRISSFPTLTTIAVISQLKHPWQI